MDLRALKERIRFFRGPRTPPCWITDVTSEFARVAGSKMEAAGGLGQDQFGYGFAIALNDDLLALLQGFEQARKVSFRLMNTDFHHTILVTLFLVISRELVEAVFGCEIGKGNLEDHRFALGRPFRKPAQRGACKTDDWLMVAARSCRLALSIPA